MTSQYQVTYTETTNPAKPPINVQDQTLNQETGLSFPGKNYPGYAPVIAENFLHLLENFACPDSGSNTPSSSLLNSPVQGQLWYNTTTSILNVFDGTSWSAAGNIKKDTTAPQDAGQGDLWVDTDNKQLYLYSGSNWLLIGPQFSAGTQTGPAVETITDADDTDHNVLALYANNNRIAIISKENFTPKQTLAGFATIGQGINLNSTDAGSSSSPTKFWGTASQADSLKVPGESVPVAASNFLRSDQTSTTNYSFNIRNNNGLTIGADLSFNVSTDSQSTVFYNKTSGASVDIRLNDNGEVSTVLHVDARNRVGVGPGNTNPQATLDVAGDVLVSGQLAVTDTTDSDILGSGSLATSGGLSVEKSVNIGGDTTVLGNIYVNKLDSSDNPVGGSVILPGSDNATLLYDIGSSTRKFRNVYAQTFQGNFNGQFTGALSGNITGSAAKLASATAFSITGDVTSTNVINFDGQTSNGTAVFSTEISQDFVTSKTEVTDSSLLDQILVYRPSVGLRKITKQTMLSNVPLVPVGAILPYAGSTAPAGYLLCDGSEVLIGTYAVLFQRIGYSYKPALLLLGKNTFALPDLRGRFPLGRDNMDNGTTVPDKNDTSILINAGGGSANRVTDVTADTLGSGSGSDTKTLDISNIPDHRHTLASGEADYFAVGRPGLTSDTNGVSPPGPQSTSAGLSVPNTGGVLTSQTSNPVNIMNPYQTLNYIIYTGVIA